MKYFFYSFFVLIFISCKSKLEVTKETIIGRWNIVHAERDGIPTKTLESAFFEFSQDGKVASNLLPTSDPMDYSLESNIVKIDGEMPFSFTILVQQNDTMNMEGLMGNYRVALTLVK